MTINKDKKDNSLRQLTSDEEKLPKEYQQFIEAGVQFGHKKSSVNSGMLPYIYCVRNNIHIIDITKTKEMLDVALDFIKKLSKEGKVILFVGTKLPVRDIVKKIAKDTGMPYIVNRWYGGTLTNWDTISERIVYLNNLREKKKSEEWKKYPKHERMGMVKEIKKLEKFFGGIEKMKKLPDALFVVDAHTNNISILEARKKGIPSIGIIDTNINPKMVNFAIPGNDDSISSVEFLLSKVKDAILKNQKNKKLKTTIKKTIKAKNTTKKFLSSN